MIEYASKNDLPAVFRLWGECFGDEEEYIRFFTQRHSDPCLLYKLGGEAVSMLFLLGGAVRICGREYAAKYIYAACTARAHRGRGYMGELIKFAAARGAKNGEGFICLVPSEKSLFGYYSRFGFLPAFKKQVSLLKRDELEALCANAAAECGKPDFKKLAALRSSLCGDAFLWDAAALEYAFDENELCSGKNLCLSDNSGYALLRGESILEMFALPESMPKLIRLILTLGDKKSYIVGGACGLAAFSQPQVVGNAMLCPLNELAAGEAQKIKNAYFGLALE